MANGQPDAAVRFARDNGYRIEPHLVPASHLDQLERFKAEGKMTTATMYEAIHARAIEAERGARVLALELANMGAPAMATTPLDTPHLARLAQFRAAGQHGAADVYEAIHGAALANECAGREEQAERAEHARLIGQASPLAGLTVSEKISRIMSGQSGMSDDDAVAALSRLGAESDARRYQRRP
ncbi:hypothetical protein WMF37_42780 [Sorangium sp. So ce291]|uniref:hypothetical protein n=1 Tax=Sorangium sp. So ce291 TaxID=3133294 RepID=UPI003F645424